jgi:hypothetical protein
MTGIEFLKSADLTVYENEDGMFPKVDHLNPGDRAAADIIEDHEDGTVDLQFGDGCVVFSVPKEIFKEVTL